MPRLRRSLSTACLLLFLGLPLSAQAADPSVRWSGLLEALRERLGATLSTVSSVWQADEGTTDPTEPTDTSSPAPSPDPAGRGGWDPNG